jgi:virulence-associated protein VagC
MPTAKLIEDKGDQVLLLPKGFEFEGTEVLIEKHGDTVILKPKPKRRSRSRSVI